MENEGNIAAVKLSEAHTTTVERDVRRAVDCEPYAAAVEFAEHQSRRTQPHDETAVDGLRCCCAGRRKDEGDAQHQPEPSHARILVGLRQSRMCSV